MPSDPAHTDAEPEALHTPESNSRGAAALRSTTPEAVVEDVLEPVAATMGFEVVHVEWGGTGKHRKLTVFLDKLDRNEGGISLGDCAKISPLLSNALDAAEEADPAVSRILSAAYLLEVSSPGIDRPLSKLSHFRSNQGGKVVVTTYGPLEPGSKQRKFHGRLQDAQPDPSAPEDNRAGTIVLVDIDTGAPYTIGLDQIRRANLVYEE